MKTIILAEKPQQGAKLEEALNLPAIPAVGHLLKLAPKNRRWSPPYFDLEWKIRKKESDRLKKIIEKLKSSEEIFIATDYDPEGQLIAYNILRQAELPVTDVSRLKFSSLENEELKRAFRNPIEFDVNLALGAEVRHYLDWYFGMNISKSLTMKLKNTTLKRRMYLTPVGRVQTPVLNLLSERERKINDFVSKDRWVVDLVGVYDGKYFEIGGIGFDEKDSAQKFAGTAINGTVNSITTSTYKIEYLPPNKDFIVEKCLRKGISSNVVDYVLQDLYLDGYISYPRTKSQKYIEHGVDTKKYLKRVQKLIPDAKTAYYNKPKEGEEVDEHPALYPIRPYEEKDLSGMVWKMIVEEFVKCHLPPEEFTTTTTKVLIGDKLIISTEDPELEEGGEFKITHQLRKSKTAPPRRLSQSYVYDWMVEQNLGTVDTRTQTLTKLMRTYIYQTDSGLFTSNKGLKIVNVLNKHYSELLSVNLTRKFEESIDLVKRGKMKVKEVLVDGKKEVSSIVERLLLEAKK